MQYSKNLKLNLPERSDQYNIDHWNENTNKLDDLIYQNELNISQNQNDISTIFNGLSTKNVNDTNSLYYKLMKLVHPVGSLYLSSNNINPSELFGGTWVQIKDKFILTAGDTYANNSIGGNSDVTLTVDKIPSHNHNISHSHKYIPSGTINEHSHTLNSHTHSFSFTNTHSHGMIHYHSRGSMEITGELYGFITGRSFPDSQKGAFTNSYRTSIDSSNTFGLTNGDRSAIIFKGSQGWTGLTSQPLTIDSNNTNKTSNETLTISGTTGASNNNTSSVATTFVGTESSTTSQSEQNSGNTGKGESFSIMPPYIVKYCWERTE